MPWDSVTSPTGGKSKVLCLSGNDWNVTSRPQSSTTLRYTISVLGHAVPPTTARPAPRPITPASSLSTSSDLFSSGTPSAGGRSVKLLLHCKYAVHADGSYLSRFSDQSDCSRALSRAVASSVMLAVPPSQPQARVADGGMTQQQVAQHFGVTCEAIRQTELKALRKLREHLEALGETDGAFPRLDRDLIGMWPRGGDDERRPDLDGQAMTLFCRPRADATMGRRPIALALREGRLQGGPAR
jgi:hypothetical protein